MNTEQHAAQLQVIGAIPQQPQRQDALEGQIRDLYLAAIRLGCDDAAKWLAASSQHLGHVPHSVPTPATTDQGEEQGPL